jgi:hypothetical protein
MDTTSSRKLAIQHGTRSSSIINGCITHRDYIQQILLTVASWPWTSYKHKEGNFVSNKLLISPPFKM